MVGLKFSCQLLVFKKMAKSKSTVEHKKKYPKLELPKTSIKNKTKQKPVFLWMLGIYNVNL